MVTRVVESTSKVAASKKFISTELKSIRDKGFSNVLRKIIFNSNVDWEKVADIIKENMPEVDLNN